MNKTELRKFIASLARGAGKIIKERFGNLEYVKFKDKFGDPVTDADYAAENYIISKIKKKFPRHSILAEEGGVDGYDHSDYLWIIDPLDGTGNFSSDMPMFCVSIALACKGEVILGAIYDPIHNELFLGEKGKGAFLNGKKIQVSGLTDPRKSRIMMSGETMETLLNINKKLLKNNFSKFREIGSAALSFAYFIAGRGDIYMSFNNKLWDIAAGVIIAQEAGAKITDLKGRKWTFKSGDIIGANKTLHKKILMVIK